jgi:hypothetical protein
VEEGQEIPSDISVPIGPVGGCGSDVSAQDFPALVVAMIVARRLSTTTTQSFMVRQETRESLSSPLGNERCVQALPEFVVTKATPLLPSGVSPTAMQNVFVGHDTPLSVPTPGGITDLAQVSPPSVVLTTFPSPRGFGVEPVGMDEDCTWFATTVPPTATHEFAEGQESAGGVSILVGSEKLAQWTPPSEVLAAIPNMV